MVQAYTAAGSDAVAKVFGTAELETLILEWLCPKTLFQVQRVRRSFYDFAQQSFRHLNEEFTERPEHWEEQLHHPQLNPLLHWDSSFNYLTSGGRFRMGDAGGTYLSSFGKTGVWADSFLTMPPCTDAWVYMHYGCAQGREGVGMSGCVECAIHDANGVTFAHIVSAVELPWRTQPHDISKIVFSLRSLRLLFKFNDDTIGHPRSHGRQIHPSGWAREERFEEAPQPPTSLKQHPKRPWQQRNEEIAILAERVLCYDAVRKVEEGHPLEAAQELEKLFKTFQTGLVNLYSKHPHLKISS